MALTKEERKILEETRDLARDIKIVVVGKNSDTGLVGWVEELERDQKDLTHRHNKLSQRFWMLVGILIGSGIISGGIYGLLNGI